MKYVYVVRMTKFEFPDEVGEWEKEESRARGIAWSLPSGYTGVFDAHIPEDVKITVTVYRSHKSKPYMGHMRMGRSTTSPFDRITRESIGSPSYDKQDIIDDVVEYMMKNTFDDTDSIDTDTSNRVPC